MVRFGLLSAALKWLTDHRVSTSADVNIGGIENPYLRRWFIIPRNRWLNIYLHEIVRSDDDRALHDHPWWNLSIILDGSMLEVMPLDAAHPSGSTVSRYLKEGNIVWRRADAAHRLEVRDGVTCRTLFITGPRIRQWGFHCPNGWRHWKVFTSFDETGDATRVGRGCGEL